MPEIGRYAPDNLFAGDMSIDTIDVTIVAGKQVKRGDVLGRVTVNVPATGTADAGNTGNGTLTQVEGRRYTKKGGYVVKCITASADGGLFSVVNPDGIHLGTARVGSYSGTGNGAMTAQKAGKDIQDGLYSVKCTVAIANSGTFEVRDPNGVLIGTFTIPVGGSYHFVSDEVCFVLADGAVDFIVNDEFLIAPFDHDEIAFVLTDGAADFIVNDFFTITVVVGNRECQIVNSLSVDGSQNPYCVASEDVDTLTNNLPKKSVGYRTGQFNERALRVGGSDDITDYIDALRDIGIFTSPSVPAGDF